MIREHHCSTEFSHSKYEVNQTTRMTLLSEIDIRESGDGFSSLRAKEILTEEKKHINSSVSNTSDWHPVTLLYQLCNDNKLPLPHFHLIEEENSLKKKIFTYEVHALQKIATGSGITKRNAKRMASEALLSGLKGSSYLNDYPCTVSSQTSISDRETRLTNISNESSVSDAICELNNLCSVQKWPYPVYALLSASGPSHNRSFTIGCAILGHPEIGEGTGPTKKEAKRTASLDLLEKINCLKHLDSVECQRGYLCDEEGQANCPDVTENPTSLLNEICICYNWPLPIYEFVTESGPPKRRQYTVGCTLLAHTELGLGYSKKEAKHAASLAILSKIREYLEDLSIPFLNKQSTRRRKKRSRSPYSNGMDATTTLHKLCASENWPHPSYEILSEEGQNNSWVYTVGCFIMGQTSLVAGTGNSKSEAKNAASQALLEKLKSNKNEIILSENVPSTDCSCEQKCENICCYGLQVNATSLLNEMCICYKWPLPKYEHLPERIVSKHKLYVVGCSLLGHSELGTGLSKTEAKLAASLAILVKIRSSIEISFLRKGIDLAERVKDPTSTLHELCSSKGWPYPDYQLLPEEGPSNQRYFTMCCIVPGHTRMAEGKGLSKAQAKHVASQAVLDMIKQSSRNSCYPSPNGYLESNMLLPKSNEKTKPKKNEDPVSELHELCASRKWPYPTYTVTQEGVSNQLFFNISCMVKDFTSTVTGRGTSKKEAKQAASQALLDKMKEAMDCSQ